MDFKRGTPSREEGVTTPRPALRVIAPCMKRRARIAKTELVPGMTKASIRRLARRAGVKRVGGEFYENAETGLRAVLALWVKDICIVTEYAKRRTATVNDVLLVLKKHGRTMYGFEERQRRRRLTTRIPEETLAESYQRVRAGRVGGRGEAVRHAALTIGARVHAGGRPSLSGPRTPGAISVTETVSMDQVSVRKCGDAGTSSQASDAAQSHNETIRSEAESAHHSSWGISTAAKPRHEAISATREPRGVGTPAAATPRAGATPSDGPSRPMSTPSAAPSPATSACGPPLPLTPERAHRIQVSLSSFREDATARGESGGTPTIALHRWVASDLAVSGEPPCTMADLEVVLDALDARAAIMITTDPDSSAPLVYFC